MTPHAYLVLFAVFVLIRFALFLKGAIMSAASDTVTAIAQEVTDATTRITAKIAELQAVIDAAPSGDDVVTPETVAALQTAADALAAVVPVPAPVEPAPVDPAQPAA